MARAIVNTISDLSASVTANTDSLISKQSKNYIINGAMDFWQRGTSFPSGQQNKYHADRFYRFRQGGGAGISSDRVSVNIPEAPEIQYGMKVKRDAGQTFTDANEILYTNETNYCIDLAGKTCVLSFYAQKNADYSAAGDVLGVNLSTGTAGNEGVIAAFTGQVNVIGSVVLTGAMQRFEVVYTFPSDMKQFRFSFSSIGVGTAGADDSFTITGIMLHEGDVAQKFQRTSKTYADELLLCQRYYEFGSLAGTSDSFNANKLSISHSYKTVKRVTPTIGGSVDRTHDGGADNNLGGIVYDNSVYGLTGYQTISGAGGVISCYTGTFTADAEL